MRERHPKKPSVYFQAENGLSVIFAKVKELEELSRRVAKYMDVRLFKSIQVANLLDNKIVLIAVNSSIATQIRIQSYDLLSQFKRDPLLRTIKEIECKVRPSKVSQRHILPRKIKPFSPETGKLISKAADSINDLKLKNIMKKISQRGNSD